MGLCAWLSVSPGCLDGALDWPDSLEPGPQPVTSKQPAPAESGSWHGEPFWQEVPAAAFKFEMLPVSGSKDGKVKPFYMSRNEVTWEAYDVFVYRLDEQGGAPNADAVTRPSKPYLPPDRGFGHEGFAAISMSYKNAEEFCKWLSAKGGRKYRLATEDEWECACLAGAATKYCWGDDPAQLGDYAWFATNSSDQPHAVGTRKANAWGFNDMHGNVQEWCVGRDGKPVTKGGSFRDDAAKLEARARALPENSWNASDPQLPKSKWWLADAPFVGFRVVCEADAPGAAGAKNGTERDKPAGR
jgi:formylglycine-generating enzyme required for sulfatase activity